MSTRRVILGLAAMVAGAALAIPALAAKPPSGGGGTGGGALYFRMQNRLWTMNSDGSGKAALPAGVDGEPSRLLHGGRRWLLTLQEVGGTNPDGTPHGEIFARGDDGVTSVQLTSDALSKSFDVCWTKDDGAFSFTAVDWSSPETVVSRLARVDLSFDGSGVPAASGSPVSILTGGVETNGNGEVSPRIRWHDWSPDGSQVVCTARTGSANSWSLEITTVASGATAHLATGSTPSWSNDGTTIAFNGSSAGIDSISPTGAGLKTLVKSSRSYGVSGPAWSPTGSHLAYAAYGRTVSTPPSWDVFRATSSGTNRVDLTSDVADQAVFVAWR